MDCFEPKLIYLTRRHPALSRAAFIGRWRQHARLGMSLPRWQNISRYVHCDLEVPVPGEELDGSYDGIGMIWHRSADHRRAHLADNSSKTIMERDESETFAVSIAEVCLVTREDVLRSPEASAPWKLTRFAPETDLIPEPADCRGHVRNYPLPPENGVRWGLDCALVEEFWFASREAAASVVSGRASGVVVVLGRDTLLYPRPALSCRRRRSMWHR